MNTPTTEITAKDAKDFLYENGYPTQINDRAKEKFLEACKEGKTNVVKSYVALKMPLDFQHGWQKSTPLTRAVEGNNPETIQYLIQTGADPEFRDGDGDTPLHTAVNWQHEAALTAMAEVGASPNVRNKGNWSPLSKAINKKFEKIVLLLLSLDTIDVNYGNHDALSPMHFAMNAYRIEWVEMILDKGYDVNALSNIKLNYTFIMRMAGGSKPPMDFRKAVAKLFIDKGVDLEVKSTLNYTAWMLAKFIADDNFADYLLQLGASTPDIRHVELFAAAGNGDLKKIKALIRDNIDPNSRNPFGQTALINAAYNNHHSVLKFLLEHGANPDILSNTNWSPLCYTAEKNNRACFDLLIKHNASPNELPGQSRALLNATRYQRPEMVRILLDKGAHVNAQDAHQQSCIVLATSKKFMDIISILMEFKPNLDLATNQGSSAISIAAKYGTEKVINLFAAAGANINLKDDSEATPLFKVCATYDANETHGKTCQVLLEAGADYTEGDKIYESPRATAVASSNQFCIDALDNWMTTGLFELHCKMPLEDFKALDEASLSPAFIDSQNYQSLSNWVRLGDLDIVQLLLEAGVDPNPNKDFSDTALLAACKAEDQAMVQLLLQHGANPNHRSNYGLTPASMSLKNDLEIFKLLVKAGVNWENENEWGGTVLTSAVESADLEKVKYVFLQYPQAALLKSPLFWPAMKSANVYMEILQWFLEDVCLYIDSRDPNGNTPLLLASEKGAEQTVRYLVEQYANINAVNHKGESALYFACSTNKEDLVLFLLQNGANPAQEVYGKSALKVSANRPTMLELLQEHLPENIDIDALKPQPVSKTAIPILHMALFQNDLEQIQQLITKGADIDEVDYRGDTILMLAINRTQRAIVEYLLEAGAKTTIKNQQEDTAWTYAVALLNDSTKEEEEASYWKALELTLGKDGIDVGQQASMYGRREELHRFIKTGKFEQLNKFLDDFEMNINAMNSFITPLTRAILHRDPDMVRFLLQKGAHPDVLSPRGNSPLFLAVQNNHHAIVDQLIKAGTTINSVDQAFLSAVSYADESIVELFLKAGVDTLIHQKEIEAEIEIEVSILDLAIRRNEPSIIELIQSYS